MRLSAALGGVFYYAPNPVRTPSPTSRPSTRASVRPPERLGPQAGADPSPLLLSLVQPHPSPGLDQRRLDRRVGVL
jgi:hypothetical protein